MMEPKAGHYDYKMIVEDVNRDLQMLDQDDGDFVYLLPRNRNKQLVHYDPYNLQVSNNQAQSLPRQSKKFSRGKVQVIQWYAYVGSSDGTSL